MKQRVRPRPQSSVDLNKNISNFSQIVNNKDLGEKIV